MTEYILWDNTNIISEKIEKIVTFLPKKKKMRKKSSKFEVSFWIIVSIISSPTLVLLLKKVSSTVTCNHTITISTFHFLSTWFFLECVAFNGKIRRVSTIPYYKLIMLSLLVVGSIILMNFNLKANSIGFYQMSKLVCIPYMVVHKMIFKHQRFSFFEIFLNGEMEQGCPEVPDVVCDCLGICSSCCHASFW